VSHDPILSRITDILDFPEWQNRKTTREYNGANVTDWWIMDFTMDEMRMLGIR